MTTLFDNRTIVRSAEVSACGLYRYSLRRTWPTPQGNLGIVCFVMLNPSTADAEVDDQTTRRCIAFATRWGYRGLVLRNLFCLRATNPKDLLTSPVDPYGPGRSDALAAARFADAIVLAWGNWVPFHADYGVAALYHGRPVYCLGRTKSGQPRHPLYLPATTKLEEWR